ncbi:MAG: GNAT family N-acetyltransferase [Candidatus Micrarchaeota archaeon]|nr:GNAT family N-acetyltransferase [Candidatus Micrarchaeota archaeon]MBU1682168.1 GNAT family N-acetyltransferase [Candidatus Micrarchaeota archaeon]
METLVVKIARSKKDLQEVMRIRITVFVNEQKVPKHLEMDGLDGAAKHVIAIYGNTPVGCARIRFTRKKAKLERLAILKKFRGKGFGKLIMFYMVDYCKRQKSSEIIIHAQYYLKEFYENLDFKIRGQAFMEAGIKHIEMYKI